MDFAIEINKLSFQYKDGTKALRDISLCIEKGTKVAILGPNGAGKSTLLLHLNGIHQMQQGELTVLAQRVGHGQEKWLRSQVGMVFQDPDDQLFSATVWDDVAFGPINQGLRGEELKKRVSGALKQVKMEAYSQKAPYHLSYGQKKRVAIAGVLAMQPEIIVLDEPAAFLDPAAKQSLFQLLDELNSQGKTIVMATHDVDLAARWADRVFLLHSGQILAEGKPSLLTNQQVVVQADLELPTVSQIFVPFPELCQPTVPVTVAEAQEIIRKLSGLKGKHLGS